MKLTAIILGLVISLFSGCKIKEDSDFKKGDGDMLYKIHHDNEGPAIKELDFMAVTMVERTENDSVLYSMYDYDARSVVLVRDKPRFKGDLNSAYGLLSEGDSVTIKINKDSLMASGRQGTEHIKGKYIIYTIKVNKVIPRGNLSDSMMNVHIQAYRDGELQQAKATEFNKIKQYITTHKLKTKTTSTGLNYIVTQKGQGHNALPGDTLLVNYTGRYLSGKLYYTTNAETAKKGGIFSSNPDVKYGAGLVVIPDYSAKYPYSAFQQAVQMFPKGSKVTLIFPSSMGFDNSQRGVPPYAPLISEMEILDIKPVKYNH